MTTLQEAARKALYTHPEPMRILTDAESER